MLVDPACRSTGQAASVLRRRYLRQRAAALLLLIQRCCSKVEAPQASLPAPFGTGPPLAMTDTAAAAGMYRCPAPGSHGSLAAFASPASAAISARTAPAVGVCPITQEVMQNPVLAADGALCLSLAPGPPHAGTRA